MMGQETSAQHMTNEEIILCLREHPELIPEVLAILTKGKAVSPAGSDTCLT